jgi:type II secretory pathway component PulF
VRLPHGLPTPDFTKITDPTLCAEAQQHWRNLEQAVVAHNSYGLVNSAASLSEALLRAFLTAPGPPKRNLSEMLDGLRKELENGGSAFSPLSYHFMQTVRVMHQSAQHPGRVVSMGRSVRPGLALTIAEGMIEVLTSIGLVQ